MDNLKTKFLILAAVMISIFNLLIIVPPAQAAGTFYGGPIIAIIPPTVICPEITVVYDYSTFTPVRLYVAPGSIIFPNYRIFSIGTFVKGLDLPIPYPTCPAAPLPIVMIGTS